MKNSMKNLMVVTMLLCGISFAEETSSTSVSGEFSTDITFGDAVRFGSHYSGLTLSGDGWELSTNLLDGMVNIEEAKYTWSLTDDVDLTFGSQAEPYGLAWGLHRPSNNWFVSTPREHNVTNGLGFGLD